jgi:hypothetical protein
MKDSGYPLSRSERIEKFSGLTPTSIPRPTVTSAIDLDRRTTGKSRVATWFPTFYI